MVWKSSEVTAVRKAGALTLLQMRNTDFILSVCFPVIFNNQSTGNPSLLVISYLVTGELFYLLYLNFSIFLLPYTTQYNFMHGCSLT